ncbi:MAG TPA: glycosyl hydrolase [Chloroflexota bacterium]|nr:glycosyl hydrolase [Chloroflexota bacterium]
MRIDTSITAKSLLPRVQRLFELSGKKILEIERTWDPKAGTPVFTVEGKYTSRGWTEWTQGFQFGSALLQFDATGDEQFLEIGTRKTLEVMATHVSHVGVHDHGFNNVSTYGNIWRLLREGRILRSAQDGKRGGGLEWMNNFCEVALKVSGAVQAARWTEARLTPDAERGSAGYIYSFNGPHSLFADTMRSLRSLAVGHQLGHVLMGERDRKISLLGRLIRHAETNAAFNVYFGEGRDTWDIRGRVAHESLFNVNDGSYRAASSQQGYSPFTTWTRGHAWCVCGYPEELEYLETVTDEDLAAYGGREKVVNMFRRSAEAVADFYLEQTPLDGIPYWDTGAPGLVQLGDYLSRPAEPDNAHEPVDASAAAIAAQGLLRLGNWLTSRGEGDKGERYRAAALTVAKTLFSEEYLSNGDQHQGLLLHSVYHRPNGWDHVPAGKKVPFGESSMWGDYHARELALLIKREAEGGQYVTFFNARAGR